MTPSAGELLDRAERTAVDLELTGLRERIRQCREQADEGAPAAPTAPMPTMITAGFDAGEPLIRPPGLYAFLSRLPLFSHRPSRVERTPK